MYWGARAIIEKAEWGYKTFRRRGKPVRRYTCLCPQSLDLLPDRQTVARVAEQPDKDKFFKWLNKEALPKLRKWVETVDQAGTEVFEYTGNGYVLRATPNASYSYLYIGAWPATGKEEPIAKAG
jgi:hypothetical protein